MDNSSNLTLRADLGDRLRELPDAALRATATEAWKAQCRVEDEGHGEAAAEVLYDLTHFLANEVERREHLLVGAWVEMECNGHFVASVVGGHPQCSCGWVADGPGLPDTSADALAHAADNGGRVLTVELAQELYPFRLGEADDA